MMRPAVRNCASPHPRTTLYSKYPRPRHYRGCCLVCVPFRSFLPRWPLSLCLCLCLCLSLSLSLSFNGPHNPSAPARPHHPALGLGGGGRKCQTPDHTYANLSSTFVFRFYNLAGERWGDCAADRTSGCRYMDYHLEPSNASVESSEESKSPRSAL